MLTGNAGLIQQGYESYTEKELGNISNGLRFTPLVCMGLAILGLYLQSPNLHFAIAAMGIIPFWFPSHHPIDLIYNSMFRHLVGGVKLPANPLPRRIACLMGGLMNIGIALSFMASNITLAYIFGGILIVLQLVVISSHFCVASWMYECALNVAGKSLSDISFQAAKSHIDEGALLVDVRNPSEFKVAHLPNAVNIPLDNIDSDERLLNNSAVLYCKIGMRSADAQKRLLKRGANKIYNLGAMDNWVR